MRNINIYEMEPKKAITQNSVIKTNSRFEKSSYSGGDIPSLMWGKVLKSTASGADIELVNGTILKSVGIKSEAFVKITDAGFATGKKDIPQVGSKVLICFPDNIIENALILCSGFDPLIPEQTEELLKDGEENIFIEIDEFGWKYKKDKTTGKISFESPDGNNKITIIFDLENKEISITQKTTSTDSNVITMNADGVTVDDCKGNTFSMESGKVVINSVFEVLQ